MKKMRKIFTLLIGMLLLSSISFAQLNCTFKLPPDFKAKAGTQIQVPVIVDGIGELAAFGFSFSWDNAVMTYVSYTVKETQVGAPNGLGNHPTGSNYFTYGWFSPAGAMLKANDTVMLITFNYTSGCSNLTFDPDNCLATDNALPEPNNYNISFTNGQVCQALTPIDITLQPADLGVCDGKEASFTIEAAIVTGYQWQYSSDAGENWDIVPDAAPYYNVNTATLNIAPVNIGLSGYLYRCVLSNEDNTKTSDAATLTVYELPTVTVTAVGAVLTADPGFVTYQWYVDGSIIDGANSDTYTATLVGTHDYWVVVSDGNGCENTSNTVSVKINPPLEISASATPGTICIGNSSLLEVTASGGTGEYSYLWTPGDYNTSSVEVFPSETTVYTVEVNDGETTKQAEVTVVVDQIPTATISYEQSTTFCQGGSVMLVAFSQQGYSYQWLLNGDPIPDANGDTYSASIAGDYTVQVTSGACSKVSDPVTVTVIDLPTAEINPNTTQNILEGQSVVFTVTTAATSIQWRKDGVDIPGATEVTYTATETGLYTAYVTEGDCSNSSNEVQVNVIPPTELQLTVNANPTDICPNATSTLTAEATGGSGSYDYQWSNDMTGGSIDVNPAETTTYFVTVTDVETSQTATGEVTVNVKPLPTSEITPLGPTTFCEGGSVNLLCFSADGYSYQWYVNGDIITDATGRLYTATQAGAYQVMETYDGCSKLSDGVQVVVNAKPAVNVTPAGPVTINEGQSVELTANTEASLIQWKKDGVDIQDENGLTYTATEAGLYTAFVSDGTCDNLSNEVQVIVNMGFTINVTAKADHICSGDMVTLQALPNPFEGDYSWNWSNGQTMMSFNDNPTETTTYFVTVTDNATSVSVEGQVTVTVDTSPVADVTPAGPIQITSPNTVTLYASTGEGYAYQWYMDGEPIDGANFENLVVDMTGEYYVVITRGLCSATSNTVQVEVITYPPLQINMSAKPQEICLDDMTTIQASVMGGSGDYSWNWSNGQTGISFNDYPTETTTYYVTVTDIVTSESIEGDITVIVYDVPIAIVTPPGPITINQGEHTTLVATPGVDLTYTWYRNGIYFFQSIDNTLDVSQAGEYYVVISQGSCSRVSNTVLVDVYIEPNVCYVNVPVNPRTVNVVNNGVNVAWDKANLEQDSAFIVRIYPKGTKNFRYRVTSATSSFMGQLTPGVEYAWQVRSRCTSYPDGVLHKSAYTAPIYFTIPVNPCPLATGLMATDITNTSATLSWNSGINANRFTIRYIDNHPGSTYHFRKTSTNPYYLQWLKPGTTYTWDVKVFCDELQTVRFYRYTNTFTTSGSYVPPRNMDVTSDVQNADLFVYPNPSNGNFTVSVSGIKDAAKLIIVNIEGQEVYNKNYNGSFTEDIDLSGLSKGMYFIKLVNENTSKVSKIVIQ